MALRAIGICRAGEADRTKPDSPTGGDLGKPSQAITPVVYGPTRLRSAHPDGTKVELGAHRLLASLSERRRAGPADRGAASAVGGSCSEMRRHPWRGRPGLSCDLVASHRSVDGCWGFGERLAFPAWGADGSGRCQGRVIGPSSRWLQATNGLLVSPVERSLGRPG